MTYPKVSIISPTYNHEKYIEKCIKSILDQTYESWEMIIIDDGSTDHTPQKILKYRDDRIRYIGQEHKGPSQLGTIYNYALSLSRGEFIAILEGDDFWSSDKLEKQVASFEDSSVVLSFSNYCIAYDSGDSLKYALPRATKIYSEFNNSPIGNALYLLFEGISPGSVTLIFRKTTLLEIGGFKQLFDLPYVDYPTLLSMTLKGHFEYVPETLGYFRRHKKSISSSSLDNQKHIIEMKSKKYEYCKEFLKQNANKITELGLSADDLDEINETRKRNELYLMFITNGKELFAMGDNIGSRKTYRQLFKQRVPPIYKFVAFIGILSTYCGVDICDIITILYTRLRKFRFKVRGRAKEIKVP